MKKGLKTKVICIILSLIIVMQVTPLVSLATEVELAEEIGSSVADKGVQEMPSRIVCEMEEKRTEYSKDFLLEDGSFYSVTSPTPLHTFVNGKWVDVCGELDLTNADSNTDEVVEAIQDLPASSNSLQRSTVSGYEDTLMVINKIDCKKTLGGGYKFGDKNAILMKPERVGDYIYKNRIITYAGLSMNCSFSVSDESDSYPFIQIREVNYEWSDDYYPDNFFEQATKIVDSLELRNTGNNTWDITDLYSRWDQGITENNGFLVFKANENSVTVSSPYLVIRYIEVQKNDVDFTYHSLDMNDAGMLYINDCTGALKIEQNLLGFQSAASALNISRTYDSMLPVFTNCAGIGFSFNYESTISLSQYYAEWVMINGDKIRFMQANPLEENGDYQLWIAVDTISNENNSIELWINKSEINKLGSSLSTIDYTELFIVANGYKLCFDQSGKLINICDSTTNASVVKITYSGSKIVEIESPGAPILCFSYTYYENIGYDYVSCIGTKNNLNEDAIPQVTFNTSYDEENEVVTHTTSFGENESVTYVYDFSGHIISASDTEGNYYEFYYSTNEDGSTGNRLIGYRKYYPGNDTPIKSLHIDSPNTYQRKFIDESGKEELIHYDKNYNIIVHKDTEGVYTCAEYDDSGIISSYTFGASENEFILNGGFESFNEETISNWNNENTGGSIAIDNNQNVSGASSLLFSNDENFFSCTSSQDVMEPLIEGSSNQSKQIFNADKTYVIGGWGRVEDAFPKDSSFFGIKIFAAPVVDGDASNVSDDDYVECVSLDFDTCTNKEWQFRMKSFKLDADSVIKVKLVCEDQFNFLYFDDIILYESKEVRTDLNNVVTSTPIEYSYSNGLISSETLTWEQDSGSNLTMGTSYTYQNGKLSEYKDINNHSTFYNYNTESGLISEIGHAKDGDGTLLDATSVIYEADSLLKSTSVAIKSVVSETNASVATETDAVENDQASSVFPEYVISTTYERDPGEKIVGVTHNGVKYCFDYNEDGTLKSIRAEQASIEDNTTASAVETDSDYSVNDYGVDYTYTDDGEISVIDYSNNYRVKHISAESESGKTITIECYSINSETQTEDWVKSYVYNFNNKGEIIQVYDSGTGITIVYEGENYTISENDGVLYQKTTDDNGNIVESYTQAYFNGVNNTNVDTITQTPTVSTCDTNDISTKSSTILVNKNVNNFVSTFDYTRSSVTDYFGRIIKKETQLDYSRPDDSGYIAIDTEYDYHSLGENKTSGLVSEYNTTISASSNESTTVLSSYNRKYEYDNKGNVSFAYTESDGAIVPKNFYEYDSANQLVTEIDFENSLCAHYTYDAGGNLTAKIYYNYSELVFDVSNRSITTWGSETSRVTYGYDNIWTDRLTNYNGTQINYDQMGNPLNYVGKNYNNASVTGTLEWNGDLLTAFESEKYRYIYQYDVNGYRTSKTVYEKKVDSDSNSYWQELYTLRYIWENGVLTGMTYSGVKTDGTRYSEQNINLIYDEEGAPVGYVTMLGVPYYFNKDINENVLSLVYTDGSMLCSFSYDSWGLPKAKFYGENWVAELVAEMTAMFCPATYHGYLYDYETGLYFNKGRCYSPSWGRYLNPEDAVKLTESSINPLDANLYLFCNNNTVNNIDKTASWSRKHAYVTWAANGFNVEMNKVFLSRTFCYIFANEIINNHGTWDINNGYNYQGMDSLRIASDLFAHCVGKYAQSAINKVNTCWGDGWILSNSKSNIICIRNDDKNAWKYEKIWFAAANIKSYAQKDGIFIAI